MMMHLPAQIDIMLKLMRRVISTLTLVFDLRIRQVTFHYVGYNESGRRIDSTYLQGSPARIRMGTNALVPGEMALPRDY